MKRPKGDNEPEARQKTVSLGQWLLDLIIGRPGTRSESRSRAAAAFAGGGNETIDDEETRRKLGAARIATTLMDMVFSMLLPALLSLGLWAALGTKLKNSGSGASLAAITFLLLLLPFLLAIVGQSILTVARGATAGGMLFGLRVVDSDGQELGFGSALWRSSIVWLSSFLFWMFPILEMAGLVLASERGLPDLICGTRLVRAQD